MGGTAGPGPVRRTAGFLTRNAVRSAHVRAGPGHAAAPGRPIGCRPLRRDPGNAAAERTPGHSFGPGRSGSRADCKAEGRQQYTPALLRRRRRLRTPHTRGHLGHCIAGRVLQQLHALPARGRPGIASAHLRIPDHDRRADRHGCRQCVAVRRRHRLCRGLPHGGGAATGSRTPARSPWRARCIRPGGRSRGRC